MQKKSWPTVHFRQFRDYHDRMKRSFRFPALLMILLTGAASADPKLPVSADEPLPAVRTIAIPRKDHGYQHLAATVLASRAEWEALFKPEAAVHADDWNDRAAFLDALKQAGVDFDREVLVLLPHNEPSGSNRVAFAAPRIEGSRVVCRIDRHVPEIGTGDMAYYCFAIAVDRSRVTEVRFDAPGRKPLRIPISTTRNGN
jgi:hypothetical protein